MCNRALILDPVMFRFFAGAQPKAISSQRAGRAWSGAEGVKCSVHQASAAGANPKDASSSSSL